MEKRSSMMLRVFINRYHPKAGNSLLKFLPENDAKAVMSQNISSTNLKPILQQSSKAIAEIHYSWLQPAIKKFPESLQPAVIAALTPKQIAGFKNTSRIELSDIGREFILNQLYQKLGLGDHLPLDYLPTTEFTPMTGWTRGQFTELADFLGLHDLASEVRGIVNRNYLKNIYSCLTPKQLKYLKYCLTQREQLVSPKLGIDPTKEDCLKLKQMIHRRGLLRLGKALCGQHPDLIWHIAHILDMGRGNVLLREFQPKELTKVTTILKQQVLNLMNFLKS